MNFTAVLVAALSTLPVGFIWFNPKVFGTIWMRESGMTEEKAKTANMFKVFGFVILFSIMAAFVMQFLVIHQLGALGMVGGPDLALTAKPSYSEFMADYGHAFRTFKHGMLHGFMSGLFLALPIIGTNAMFEMKSWKYIFVHAGYWIVCFTIMGGILSAWE
jgi:hypothetical protein